MKLGNPAPLGGLVVQVEKTGDRLRGSKIFLAIRRGLIGPRSMQILSGVSVLRNKPNRQVEHTPSYRPLVHGSTADPPVIAESFLQQKWFFLLGRPTKKRFFFRGATEKRYIFYRGQQKNQIVSNLKKKNV